jgi:pyridoxine 5-phosphate synthase
MRLFINIDHVATVRQARGTDEPDPMRAAVLAELGGADGITVHLRQDRRHIQDRDVELLRRTLHSPMNLEMANVTEMEAIALEIVPHQVTLVPENRQEITTEGGLDVVANAEKIKTCVGQLKSAGIEVSLFIDPDVRQIETADSLLVDAVELHTGRYADATTAKAREQEFDQLVSATDFGIERDLLVHMGHGLTYRNVGPIAEIVGVSELNIGHSIVARALMVGFEEAVREMRSLITL